MLINYDKIVRDLIPEIITHKGKKCEVKFVSDDEAIKYLAKKIYEEADEFNQSGEVEELADLIEVIENIAIKKGHDLDYVLKIKELKKIERGAFERNIILKKVYRPDA